MQVPIFHPIQNRATLSLLRTMANHTFTNLYQHLRFNQNGRHLLLCFGIGFLPVHATQENKDEQDPNKEGNQGNNKEDGEPKNEGDQKKKEKDQQNKPLENKKQAPNEGQLSPQQVQSLLEAMNNQEKKVQDKVNAKKVKGVPVRSKKDW